MTRALLLFILLFLTHPAQALVIETPLPDAAQEARARALFRGIRCVVCQSESVADSPAAIATDIRRLIREQIAAGKSDADIKAGLVQHYGDYILMKPPLNDSTWLLWYGPALALLIAFAIAICYFRHASRGTVP